MLLTFSGWAIGGRDLTQLPLDLCILMRRARVGKGEVWRCDINLHIAFASISCNWILELTAYLYMHVYFEEACLASVSSTSLACMCINTKLHIHLHSVHVSNPIYQ